MDPKGPTWPETNVTSYTQSQETWIVVAWRAQSMLQSCNWWKEWQSNWCQNHKLLSNFHPRNTDASWPPHFRMNSTSPPEVRHTWPLTVHPKLETCMTVAWSVCWHHSVEFLCPAMEVSVSSKFLEATHWVLQSLLLKCHYFPWGPDYQRGKARNRKIMSLTIFLFVGPDQRRDWRYTESAHWFQWTNRCEKDAIMQSPLWHPLLQWSSTQQRRERKDTVLMRESDSTTISLDLMAESAAAEQTTHPGLNCWRIILHQFEKQSTQQGMNYELVFHPDPDPDKVT